MAKVIAEVTPKFLQDFADAWNHPLRSRVDARPGALHNEQLYTSTPLRRLIRHEKHGHQPASSSSCRLRTRLP